MVDEGEEYVGTSTERTGGVGTTVDKALEGLADLNSGNCLKGHPETPNRAAARIGIQTDQMILFKTTKS